MKGLDFWFKLRYAHVTEAKVALMVAPTGQERWVGFSPARSITSIDQNS